MTVRCRTSHAERVEKLDRPELVSRLYPERGGRGQMDYNY